ncbi:hypothetical protein ES703_36970 [subsurface metagenome]
MKYWLCITNEANWEIVKAKEVWGVSDRHKDKIFMTKEGDKLIFYIKPMKVGGIFEVISKPFQEKNIIFKGEAYPFRINIKPITISKKFLEFRPLVSELRFITQKRRWGGHLQGKAMKPIPKEDFELIEKKLEKLL